MVYVIFRVLVKIAFTLHLKHSNFWLLNDINKVRLCMFAIQLGSPNLTAEVVFLVMRDPSMNEL